MPIVTSKKEMLESAGYRYNFNRMVYFNQAARKVFSVEAIEDDSEQWLHDRIAEKNGERGWRFYFNAPPSDAIEQELVNELE
jgi:hypothetical protein